MQIPKQLGSLVQTELKTLTDVNLTAALKVPHAPTFAPLLSPFLTDFSPPPPPPPPPAGYCAILSAHAHRVLIGERVTRCYDQMTNGSLQVLATALGPRLEPLPLPAPAVPPPGTLNLVNDLPLLILNDVLANVLGPR